MTKYCYTYIWLINTSKERLFWEAIPNPPTSGRRPNALPEPSAQAPLRSSCRRPPWPRPCRSSGPAAAGRSRPPHRGSPRESCPCSSRCRRCPAWRWWPSSPRVAPRTAETRWTCPEKTRLLESSILTHLCLALPFGNAWPKFRC